MSIELTVYLTILVLAYTTILNTKLFNFFVVSYLIFLVVMRYSGLDLDIGMFIKTIKKDVWNIYIYKEFAFWLTGRFFYFITKDDVLTFVLFDIFWFSTILIALRTGWNNADGKTVLIILLVSFPFILGEENLYRQHFAIVFMLSSLLVKDKKFGLAFCLVLISLFMHNSAIVFLPMLISKKFFNFSFKYRIILSHIFLFLIISAVFLVRAGGIEGLNKSSADTGLDLRLAYFGILAVFLYFFIFKFKLHLISVIDKFPSVYFGLIIVTVMMQFQGTAPVERLGMSFFVFFTYDFFSYIYEKDDSSVYAKYLALLYAILFSIPALLFGSIRTFLVSS